MSGYTDDYDASAGDQPPGDPRDAIERARARVRPPAVLLMATGAVGLLLAAVNLAFSPDLGPKIDEKVAAQNDKIDNNADLSADQKQAQKDMVAKVADAVKQAAVPV